MSLHNIPPVFNESNVNKAGYKVLTGPIQRLTAGRTAKSCKDWTWKGKKFASFSVCCYVLLQLPWARLPPSVFIALYTEEMEAAHSSASLEPNTAQSKAERKEKAESAPTFYLSASQISFCKLASNSSSTSSFLALIPYQQDISPYPYSWQCPSSVPWDPHLITQKWSNPPYDKKFPHLN